MLSVGDFPVDEMRRGASLCSEGQRSVWEEDLTFRVFTLNLNSVEKRQAAISTSFLLYSRAKF